MLFDEEDQIEIKSLSQGKGRFFASSQVGTNGKFIYLENNVNETSNAVISSFELGEGEIILPNSFYLIDDEAKLGAMASNDRLRVCTDLECMYILQPNILDFSVVTKSSVMQIASYDYSTEEIQLRRYEASGTEA